MVHPRDTSVLASARDKTAEMARLSSTTEKGLETKASALCPTGSSAELVRIIGRFG